MTTTKQAWQPNDNDHLIFEWVKMQGKTQGEVASLLRISQPTVCRVIQRYERWMAHMKGRENGRLDPQERLRAQRQLTFDRNELILASCLRIAYDMEGSMDGTRSVISRPMSNYTQEKEIRTTHFTIDRTGTVCRFLRLAFRINMEQEKLTLRMAKEGDVREGKAPAEPAPLTDQELTEQARQATLDDREIAAGTLRVRENRDGAPTDDLVTREKPGDAPTRGSSLGEPPATSTTQQTQSETESPSAPELEQETLSVPSPNPEPRVPSPEIRPTPVHNLNNVNTDSPLQIAANSNNSCTCAIQLDSEKIVHTCTTDDAPRPEPDVNSNRRLSRQKQSAPA